MFCDVETGFVSILFWRETNVEVKPEDIAASDYKRNFQADEYPQNLWLLSSLLLIYG